MPTKKSAKKTRTLKQAPPLEHIEGNFELVACDLSLYCPGFACFDYDAATRSVSLTRICHVSNRN